jgi:WD40 repeat protein
VIRAADGTTLGTVKLGAAVTAAKPAPDGKAIAVAAGRWIHLYRLPDLHSIRSFKQTAGITAIAFSDDGSRLATAGEDGIARIWRVDGQPLHDLGNPGRPLTGVAFSPSGRLVATSSDDGRARIWDARSGALRETLAHKKGVASVAFSPDGRLVLTASVDHKARIWRVQSGKATQLSWHLTTVNDAEFSPDGHWVVTAGQQAVQIWLVKDASLLFPFGIGGPADTITSAVFGPTSRTVLAASKDGTVRTYHCALCGGVDELLGLAHRQLRRTG